MRMLTNFITAASSLIVLPALIAGCSTGFYRLHTVALEPTHPTHTSDTSVAPDAVGSLETHADHSREAEPVVPYLTLTAYGYTDNLLTSTSSFNHDFQIFKLDAEFESSPKAPFSVAIMAVDLNTGVNHAGHGQDILKAVPIDFGSNQTFNFTLHSSGVEKNLADKFLAGLSVVEDNAKTLALSAGPQYSVALGAATQVLKAFQSPNLATKDSITLTLNSPSGITFDGPLEDKTKAIVIVPTGGSTWSQFLSSLGIYGSNHDYERRVEALNSSRLRLCPGDQTRLCSNGGKPFSDFAYVLLVPTVQQRISYPEFLWTRGTCHFTRDELEKYKTRLSNSQGSLSASQVGMEQEIIATYSNLLAIREAARDDRAGAILNTINDEWSHHALTGWQGGSLYGDVRDRLRKCMVEEGEGYRSGVFKAYVEARETAYQAEQRKEPTQKLAAYRVARSQLDGLLRAASDLRIDSAEVRDRLHSDIAALENAIYQTAFEKPIGQLGASDGAVRIAAQNELRELLATVDCTMCKARGEAALGNAIQVNGSKENEVRVEPAVGSSSPATAASAL
jgi:hypothetical protein